MDREHGDRDRGRERREERPGRREEGRRGPPPPPPRTRRPSYRGEVAGPPIVEPPAYKPEDLAKTAEKIAAACLEVHRQMGSYLDPTIYHRALTLELQARGIPFEREGRVPVSYRGLQIESRRVDFIVDGCLVELHSQPELSMEDLTRARNYLRVSGYKCTVVVNFGTTKIDVKSLIV
ncbi:MAG: GxxExxY protein [Chloroflexota bacterium]